MITAKHTRTIPHILPRQFLLLALLVQIIPIAASAADPIDIGERPAKLIAALPQGELQSTLSACADLPAKRSEFSIGHRGAPFQYPEHTREGYIAAADSGAGLIECDVTFTNDQALVCRHSQCDLHSTTNILETPLAQMCSVPPNMDSSTPFSDVKCCTSDISVAQFKSLKGRFDNVNKKAKTLTEYLSLENTAHASAEVTDGTLMTHSESIKLFKSMGVKMIPELKAADVAMPHTFANGEQWTQAAYAQALVDEYMAAAIKPADVFLQSFDLKDVQYWVKNTPEFGLQATWLDGRYRDRNFKIDSEKTWDPSMASLAESGVTILAPPLWMLLTLDSDKNIIPSAYAKAATEAGIDLIGWTLERSGPLDNGGGWYYQTIKQAVKNDSAIYEALHVLHTDVGVRGMFSDWPATTTYYANCLGIE